MKPVDKRLIGKGGILMSDLISRQAAIDAYCELCGDIDLCKSIYFGIPCDYVKALEQLPSAQPEIIRCKDCIDYHRYPNTRYCVIMESTMPEDGFCSYAERRTDD